MAAFTSKCGGEITIPKRKGKKITMLQVTFKKAPKVVAKSNRIQMLNQRFPNISLLK